ncbi:MAG: Trk family potassium uptake protein [Clostridia bacterium]|nr:Trk family potassium uptake protein [Clostridia bacterium]
MAFHKLKMKMTNTRIIAISFALVILVGTILLCTPFASAEGSWTHPVDALFTATTSTCVTGLVVFDTGAHWSLFGQIVILFLVQIGGIGFMTVVTLFSFFVHRKVSLHERRLLLQSMGSFQMSGVMATFRQILIGTLLVEGVGAALLACRFYPVYGGKGIWYAVFHSISAFCNAGLDLFGPEGSSSLSMFRNDPLVSFTILFLIVVGGLGFLVWDDLLRNAFRFRRLRLHSKLVLCVTGVLLFGGCVLFYMTEYNHAFAGMSQGERWMSALFQSVTVRTAGFFTVDQTALSDTGAIGSICLMFVGGSPGSTAGGIKTTTAAIFLFSILRFAQNKDTVVFGKRRIENRIVRQAGAIVGVYLLMAVIAAALICAMEDAPFLAVVYETVSAVATVGLSMNLTPTLCIGSKLILIFLMYAGRLGGLSLFLALGETAKAEPLERPTEKVLIG